MTTVLITAVFAAALALVLGVALGIFRKVFHVETDVLVALVRETLPGANCGACGFPGCDGFAVAVAARTADPAKCTVSSAEDTKKRGDLLGVDASSVPKTALLVCRGTKDCAKPQGRYSGVQSCIGAKIATGGTKLCSWGCLGFGDCARVCSFGALGIGDDGLPVVNKDLCTGCGRCIEECPQGLLKLLPRDQRGAIALCANRNVVKPAVRKACSAGCIKCEICVKKCPAAALTMENGIPVTDYGKCTSCGLCVTACPSKVLVLI
jgi:Na+-translocating ferredoxin:NAD+ oxidoreductase RNF subunit RnfB